MFIKEKEIFKNKYPNRYKIFTEIFSLEDYETNPTLLGMLIQL